VISPVGSVATSAARSAADTRPDAAPVIAFVSAATAPASNDAATAPLRPRSPQPAQGLASGDEAVRVVFGDLLGQVALELGHVGAS
jgi:hypothetical protein